MSTTELHKAQISILHMLRHTPKARYAELRRPTDMDSDVFKFHLRNLVHQCYIRKLDSGAYELTPSGKEFANNLSKLQRTVQKQPKLSVAIIASRELGGLTQYLFQQRLRQPFYGFWGCLSGPVQWGEAIEAAAQLEFEKQTGLRADYTVRSFYRQTDYVAEGNALLEDKLFALVAATGVRGSLTNGWQNGFNAWMTLAELESQEKHFAVTSEYLEMLSRSDTYRAGRVVYGPDEY